MAQRVALVTGASSGIGAATALEFGRRGVRVALTARNAQRLAQIAAEITSAGGDAHCFPGDLQSRDDMAKVVAGAVSHFGRLDILVNSAGILVPGNIQSTSEQDFDKTFDINVKSVFVLSQMCIEHLAKTKGCIVNVSSVNGLQSFAGVNAYCASKSAVDQITRCSAMDLAPLGIRVNAVNPGVVKTELQRRGGLSEEAYAGFLKRSLETHPICASGRDVAEPKEIAAAIAFLADNDSAGFITGACLPVDGGRSCMGAR